VTAFEQRACLERVHERDHATRRYLQSLADRLLGLALGGADRAQQRELARLERQRRERLAKAPGDRIADRGEREADRAKRHVIRLRGWRHARRPRLISMLRINHHEMIISQRKDL